MTDDRQRIDVPDLNCVSALNFCNYLGTLPSDGKYDFCFLSHATYDPFPMLIVSSSIRRFRKRNVKPNENFRVYNRYKNGYAAHMGFYNACGWNVGNDVGGATGSSRYLPVTKISLEELEEKSRLNRTTIQDEIEKLARELATVLSRRDTELEEALTFLLREIIRNTPEHGQVGEVWYCAQYWPTYNLVELAIMDEGCGIHNSLKSNKSLEKYIISDETALEYALKPGISRAINLKRKRRNTDDYWENSGYGLYMASQICVRLGGSFTVVSGKKAVHLKADRMTGTYMRKVYDTDFKGTAIAMRIKTNKIASYQKIRSDTLKKGEMIAKDTENAIKTASKSSRGLVNRTIK